MFAAALPLYTELSEDEAMKGGWGGDKSTELPLAWPVEMLSSSLARPRRLKTLRPGIDIPGSGFPGYAWKGNVKEEGGGRGEGSLSESEGMSNEPSDSVPLFVVSAMNKSRGGLGDCSWASGMAELWISGVAIEF